VRNLINIFLHDIETQQFDLSRLEALQPYRPLLDFYKGEGRFAKLGPQTPGAPLPTHAPHAPAYFGTAGQRTTLSRASAAAWLGWNC
jgi:hypothetical protein